MKRFTLIMVTLIFILTGCVSVETVLVPAAPPTDNPQAQTAAPDSEAMGDMPITEDTQNSTAQSGGDITLNYEILTEPPALTVSTLSNTDQVIASRNNSQWKRTLPNGLVSSVNGCGTNPLDQQEHPTLHTTYSAENLPSSKAEEPFAPMAPIFYLDFGEILPETISAICWPASYIGNAQKDKDFEKVMVEINEDTITLIPLEDGDYVYEVSARWGETGHASYVFRAQP